MPIDRGVIDQQLHALRESTHWWDQREFRDLPAVLHEDETILALARGKLRRPKGLSRSWLMVVTDQRLVCLRSDAGPGWRQIEIAGDQIARISPRIGMFRGHVIVVAGGHTYRLRVPRPDAYRLMNALSTLGTQVNETATGFAPTRVVRRVMDHMLALPAVALNPGTIPQPAKVVRKPDPVQEQRVQSLEDEIEELRQQVQFLEELLRQRHPALSSGDRQPES